MEPKLRELLARLIHDRANSADIPWHTTQIIDDIQAFIEALPEGSG